MDHLELNDDGIIDDSMIHSGNEDDGIPGDEDLDDVDKTSDADLDGDDNGN